MSNFLRRSAQGAGVPHEKGTSNLETVAMPLPSKIVLSMGQHIGAPAAPAVAKGDQVYVGTVVGKAGGFVSADIHSGVSGTVTEITTITAPNGAAQQAVVITPDGQQTVDPSIAPPQVTDMKSFVDAVRASGLVGLGGAGFPTDIKLAPPNLEEIDLYVVNATECEPYLSTDYREMMESPDDVLFGIRETCRHLGIPNAMICIESNKPKAIELHARAHEDDSSIQVKALPSRYPQGAENVLVHNATGRVVPRGKRQTDVGVMLNNVTTMASIGRFLKTGMPLVKRRFTVSGDAIARPCNANIIIGTRLRDVMEFAGLTKEPHKVVLGGPMMGNAQIDMDYPVIRQNNGVLVFSKDAMEQPATTACIRCGRCTNSCPMQLSPIAIKKAYTVQDAKKLDDLMADLCMGCGTCSFVCPAKQPLAQTSKLARDFMRAEMARRG